LKLYRLRFIQLVSNNEGNNPLSEIIHGTLDGVLPYNSSSEYSSSKAVLKFWNDFNNTGTTPILNSDLKLCIKIYY